MVPFGMVPFVYMVTGEFPYTWFWEWIPVWLYCCYYGWLIHCLILIYAWWALRYIDVSCLIIWAVISLWYCLGGVASPVDIIGIVGCYDIIALSLVMTACWDLSPVGMAPFMYMVTGESPYTWLLGFFPVWLYCCYYGWLIYCLILINAWWALRDIAMNC